MEEPKEGIEIDCECVIKASTIKDYVKKILMHLALMVLPSGIPVHPYGRVTTR